MTIDRAALGEPDGEKTSQQERFNYLTGPHNGCYRDTSQRQQWTIAIPLKDIPQRSTKYHYQANQSHYTALASFFRRPAISTPCSSPSPPNLL